MQRGRRIRGRSRRWAPVALGAVAVLVAGTVAAVALISTGPDDEQAHPRRRIAILPLGDSITLGYTSGTTTTPGGYRGPLDRLLDDAGVPHSFVGTSTLNPPAQTNPDRFRHDGWPGARVDELDAALTGPSRLGGGRWLTRGGAGAVRPDVVVVMAGTNDVHQRHDPAGFSEATFATHLVDRMEALVGHLVALLPGVAVVLCTIPPQSDPGQPGNTALASEYDDGLRALAARLRNDGVRIELADVEQALAGRGLVSGDGIHPVPAGYLPIAEVIASAIERIPPE